MSKNCLMFGIMRTFKKYRQDSTRDLGKKALRGASKVL